MVRVVIVVVVASMKRSWYDRQCEVAWSSVCDGADEFLAVFWGPIVAAYLPIVQDSLPRILNAAAPPGSAARENRKQCLKVRLCFQRTLGRSVVRV